MNEETYPHVFYNARWYGYAGLIFGLCFLSMAVVGLVSQRFNELAGLFFLIIAGAFIWIGWKAIKSKEPVFQFGRVGIWTPKIGAVQWQDVVLEFTRVTTGKSGSFDFLRITDKQTLKPLDSVSITGMNESSEAIKDLLQNYKKAQFKKTK